MLDLVSCRHLEAAEVDADAEITGEDCTDGSSCCSSENSAGMECNLAPGKEDSMPTTSARQVIISPLKAALFMPSAILAHLITFEI